MWWPRRQTESPRDQAPLTEAMAGAIRQFVYDPNAKRSYEALSGGFVWSDEWSEALARACAAAGAEHGYVFRLLWAYRASLTRGQPDPRFRDLWEAMEKNHPSWPGLHPSRRSRELQAQLEAEAARELAELEEDGRVRVRSIPEVLGALERSVGNLLYALAEIAWSPFETRAQLILTRISDTGSLVLSLDGLHFISLRQTLLDGRRGLGPDCEVRALRFYDNDDLVAGLLFDKIFGPTNKMFLYDLRSHSITEACGRRPMHLVLNCSAGILDAVCETVNGVALE